MYAPFSSAIGCSDGFLLLDVFMNPIFVNAAAVQILSHPDSAPAETDFISGKIHSVLFVKRSSGAALVSRFQSGRRVYSCRAFEVDPPAGHEVALAVLLERESRRSSLLAGLPQRFHLTTRETEVFVNLLQGFTSKEIATRMSISPNTVKTFLRLIMVKMGVSTRSGIVGKAYNIEEFAAPKILEGYQPRTSSELRARDLA